VSAFFDKQPVLAADSAGYQFLGRGILQLMVAAANLKLSLVGFQLPQRVNVPD
jgi:hypothetical protein